VLLFGGREAPRALSGLPRTRVGDPRDIDAALAGAQRLAVLGSQADLAAVLTRLMRTDRLDVEVAHVRGWAGARRARTGTARRVPLVRDDTGTALAHSALWLPPGGAVVIRGEAVADDTVLFDGEAAGVRIEPTADLPGVRAALLGTGPRRWLTARAVQLGTTGARVERDGVQGAREVRRSTFYRHTTGWLRVG
jgi:hypothetical protein